MPSNNPWNYSRNPSLADDIDFAIRGHDLQFVEIELDPGESAVGEAGVMVWKDASVEMSAVFGDGSESGDTGFMGKLLGAGGAHPNVCRLVEVLADFSSDDMFLGARRTAASPRHRRASTLE